MPKTSTCFVDLEKACDRVPRENLWGVLREYGFDGRLILAVKSLQCFSTGFPRNLRVPRVVARVLPKQTEIAWNENCNRSPERFQQCYCFTVSLRLRIALKTLFINCIGVGADKFLGVRRVLARISTSLHEKSSKENDLQKNKKTTAFLLIGAFFKSKHTSSTINHLCPNFSKLPKFPLACRKQQKAWPQKRKK